LLAETKERIPNCARTSLNLEVGLSEIERMISELEAMG
jgi:hypothetical protein